MSNEKIISALEERGLSVVDQEKMDEDELFEIALELIQEQDAEEVYEEANQFLFRTRENIVDKLTEVYEVLEENPDSYFAYYGKGFVELFRKNLLRFIDVIKSTCLVEPLPKEWCYVVVFKMSEFTLNLRKWKVEYDYDSNFEIQEGDINTLEEFNIIKMPIKSLNIAEYAASRNVKDVTVRQWIRRSKIRCAYKKGKEWLIPELAQREGEEYSLAVYAWDEIISGLPDEYNYFNDYSSAMFEASGDGNYIMTLRKPSVFSTENKEVFLTTKEREKIELLLMQASEVEYCDNQLGTFNSMESDSWLSINMFRN